MPGRSRQRPALASQAAQEGRSAAAWPQSLNSKPLPQWSSRW